MPLRCVSVAAPDISDCVDAFSDPDLCRERANGTADICSPSVLDRR